MTDPSGLILAKAVDSKLARSLRPHRLKTELNLLFLRFSRAVRWWPNKRRAAKQGVQFWVVVQ